MAAKGCPNRNASQQRHASLGKALRCGAGPGGRQFQHQIHTAPQGRLGPGLLVHHSQIAPLDNVAAHHCYNIRILPQLSPQGRQLPGMAPVEGIVFRNDTCHSHGLSPLPPQIQKSRSGQEFFRKNYEKTVV